MSEKPRTGCLGGFDLLAQEAADEARRMVAHLQERAFGDSPIEQLLFAALVTAANQGGRSITDITTFGGSYCLEDARYGTRMMGNPLSTAFVEKQVQVAGWRVDFLIYYPALEREYNEFNEPNLDRLIVECDGHDFHERTKQQAARDRARDRLAQLEGLPILRFTGSEIWNDPIGCADEILAFMERA